MRFATQSFGDKGYKTFYSVKKARAFIPGNNFHPSLTFACEASTSSSSIYTTLDWHFICSIDLKYSCIFSNGQFSTHAVSHSLLCSIFQSVNSLLSFSLSLSSAHSPLCFYLPPFYIKGNWFVWLASLKKCIWMSVVPHLGFAHNVIHLLYRSEV